ncbi:STM4504/CBY_0614 family protein [Pseudomonas sp. NPDC089530]|uniref:STM4504/CBY_0614 family protein n=1 Tax=Pseudomonas sp. NPDC089530 TaxID=3390651 RepID=UPI003D03742F
MDLYSKRQQRLRGEVSDVYSYDSFPGTFRVQLSFMIEELLGDLNEYFSYHQAKRAYTDIVKVLRKEYGQQSITKVHHNEPYSELHNFLIEERDVERCLDAIELCFGLGDSVARSSTYIKRSTPNERVDECLAELNERFKEAGLGYEFIDGRIVRMDSQLLHSEIVKPAIGFLNAEGFEGARDEFFGAYEHYRHGNHEEALVDALKAFESTMKVILIANEKTYGAGDTASKLILACRDAELMPAYNESQLQSLVNVLNSGIPTLRNKNGGHGQGEAVRTVEPEIVAYGLHLTASAIVMLAGLEAKRRSAP